MRVLVACEFSCVVRDAMRLRGHDAWSADIEPPEGNPDFHIFGDVLFALDQGWDLMIAHPPCTYLSVSGMHWTKRGLRDPKLTEDALDFVNLLLNAPIKMIAIENPISIISSRIRKPDQIIQPYEYGHDASKTTCLWLKNLESLKPTNIVEPIWITTEKGNRFNKLQYDTYLLPKKERWKVRSATFPGIAKAMAQQWGNNV